MKLFFWNQVASGFWYKNETSIQCCLENYKRETQDVSLKEILATCVLQMRSLRPKETNCLPIWVLRKKER